MRSEGTIRRCCGRRYPGATGVWSLTLAALRGGGGGAVGEDCGIEIERP